MVINVWSSDQNISIPLKYVGDANSVCYCSVAIVSDSSWLYELQHSRLPCPSPSPGVCPNSSPLSWTVICYPLLLLPSVFPSIRVFPMSWLFVSDGQRIGALASASVLPMNIQVWFLFGLTSLIFLLSKGVSRVFQHHNLKTSILQHSTFFVIQLSHLYMTTRKTIALNIELKLEQILKPD